MARLSTYTTVSLDGFFADAQSDMSWAHKADPEWQAYVTQNAGGGGGLMFGRVTYELMIRYWPTPQATERTPAVAERMNALPKVVFSRTLAQASWKNTTLFADDLVGSVRRLKGQPGPDFVILGSGSLVAQLTEAGLIDEFKIVVSPIVLGGGQTLFEGVSRKTSMKLVDSRAFGNGNVVLTYEPTNQVFLESAPA
jgi:dihydrofolate reductase